VQISAIFPFGLFCYLFGFLGRLFRPVSGYSTKASLTRARNKKPIFAGVFN
jgi:hypothetical protein